MTGPTLPAVHAMSPPMIRLLALVLGALVLAGCYNGHFFDVAVMEKADMSHFYQDKLDCHTYRFLGVEERAHYKLCMQARGYHEKGEVNEYPSGAGRSPAAKD